MDIELVFVIGDREKHADGSVTWSNHKANRVLVTGTGGEVKPLIVEAVSQLEKYLMNMSGVVSIAKTEDDGFVRFQDEG